METTNKFEVFKNDEFGQIRVMVQSNNPWFIAADVCKALGIGNPSMAIARLDDDEKMTLSSTEGHSNKRGGAQMYSLVNESGLYTLVLTSRKKCAADFKRWITHDVIPSIRKHGAYMTDDLAAEVLENPNKIYEIAENLLRERDLRIRIQKEMDEARPKAVYYDAFISRDTLMTIKNVAMELGFSEERFINYLCKRKYLFRAPAGNLLPYAKKANEGMFAVRDFYYCRGEIGAYTLLTPMGVEHFRTRAEKILAFEE